ncbi:Hob2p KNAG_0A07660 [Huiozyma naganishii CBS 8797]|uniref:Uncharacterized protein n=1 Tax=Huiozyma naganishii (strain ATCC MYA-139 / BCRC 22969 / CBS 8797 / KCTC 17520 / NBRC 10181 / NCYC 3082 / Yp74L-3) TaxID=1071383 RepID=J7S2Z3_HUIN7|nr:hypothetical protein KNAG_0A07660 [Kazachstania naganishii CBS 8797]CCK68419.1 hypothetical protein KNAG_0A07660 [Kazachstania naganishii CBS 8797]
MYTEYFWSKLFSLFKILVLFIAGSLAVQTVLRLLISVVVRVAHLPIDSLSYGYIFGPSLRKIRVSTKHVVISINRITFRIGWKPSIIFHDVDLQILSSKDSLPKATPQPKEGNESPQNTNLNGGKISFHVDKRFLKLLQWICSVSTFCRRLHLTLPNDTIISVELSSFTLTHKPDKSIFAEVFLHEVRNDKTDEKINHVGFTTNFIMLRETKQFSRTAKVTLLEWHSSLKLANISVHMSKHLDLFRPRKGTGLAKPTSEFRAAAETNKLIPSFITSFHKPLKTLNILDIKIENLKLTYLDVLTIRISSVQLYLETINILDNGSSYNILPSTKRNWGEFELTISANTVNVIMDQVSTLRIPLINFIITTNVLLHYINDIPLNKTTVSCTTNVINPAIFSTIDQLIKGIQFVKILKGVTSANKTENPVKEGIHLADTKKDIKLPLDLNKLPNFSLEFTLSNFTSIFQLSRRRHLTFKIFNIQSVTGRSNKYSSKSGKAMVLMKQGWNSTGSMPAAQRSSNYLKIVGTECAYLNVPDDDSEEQPLSIPILGFERVDTFVDEISTSKLNVQSTLRSFYCNLEHICVLDTLLDIYSKVREILPKERKKTKADHLKPKGTFEWCLKFRMKNTSFALILKDYLAKHLDPVELDGFNLSAVARGFKLDVNESSFMLTDQMNSFVIASAALFRIMDNEKHESVSNSVLQFRDFSIVLSRNRQVKIELPAIRIKFDVNVMWLIFYAESVISHYSNHSDQSVENTKAGYSNSRLSQKTHISIGKVIIDVTLPENIPMLVLFSDIKYQSNTKVLVVDTFSILVKSVYIKQRTVYVILMEMRDIKFDIQEFISSKNVSIEPALIQFHTEYHFKVYTITDNIVTLYKCFKQLGLAFLNVNKFERLYPMMMKPTKLPHITVKTESFLIDIEEDPFEQELGLILKVGILEQRERLAKLREFEEQIAPLHSSDIKPSDLERIFGQNIHHLTANEQSDRVMEMRYKLLKNISTSWIVRYQKAKLVFHGMPYRVTEFEDFGVQYTIFSRQKASTVANLIIENMELEFGPPSFALNKFDEFLFDYGKGVPKDSLYTILIIMGISFKTNLWELKIRDYPIPFLSFPNTSTHGDVVFAEQMPDSGALHSIYVPFVSSADNPAYETNNSIYGTHIIRTMNSIKVYANCETVVDTDSPTCITWGKSLQPSFESLMLWFDFLTKPRLDPSPNMGFWDKCRFLFHGKWSYRFLNSSGLHLNIKGAHNPYKIADDGAGLTFCWSGNTKLDVHGSSDPKEFLKITSQAFELGIRDFTVNNKFDKILTRLYGAVTWKMGMLFEKGNNQDPGKDRRQIPARPHHDIHLMNPDYVEGRSLHDSYDGFRSNFINMSFGVYSFEKGSSNSFFLAPRAMDHFVTWWKLFNTYTSGPIRQGNLFPELIQKNKKFGRSLFTIKYQLHLEPLTVSYVYKHIFSQFATDKKTKAVFTGLKGRCDSLKIDLHQRKIKLTHRNAKLNRSKPVWKFRMSTGELDCTNADVRILSTEFDKNIVDEILTTKQDKTMPIARHMSPIDVEMFRESDWYDYEDYLDLVQPLLETSFPLKLEAIPLLYSPRISYFRQLNETGLPVEFPFGDEKSHICLIGRNHPEKTQEQLAKKRKNEIRDAIGNLQLTIDNMTYSNYPEDGETKKKLKALEEEIHELQKRLHIIDKILCDLKISSRISQPNNSASSDTSSLEDTEVSASELSAAPSTISLLRTNTVESFVSMRRVSTVQIGSTYDNRFIVHNIQLKLDKRIRDHLLEYFTSIFERRTMNFSMSYKSVKIIQDLLRNVSSQLKGNLGFFQNMFEDDESGVTNTEFIERFEELIKEVPDSSCESVDSYLFRLISPQIQIRSECEPDTSILVSARDIEVGIIDIIQCTDSEGKRIAMDINTIVETRYCAVTKDIQLFIVSREDVSTYKTRLFYKNGYGMEKWSEYWPPWIPLELCFDGSLLEQHVFLKRRSMFFTFIKPNPLYFNNNDKVQVSNDSKFRIGFPGLVLSSTSQQYCSVYAIVQDLLSFTTDSTEKMDKLAGVLLADEVRNNLNRLDSSFITSLQTRVKDLYYIRAFLKVNDPKLYSKISADLIAEIQTSVLRLTVLMKAIKQTYDRLGSSTDRNRRIKWQVGTDELIWELFDGEGRSFVTIGLGISTFLRTATAEGTASNRVSIVSLRCFNLQKNPVFIELLAPNEENSRYDTKKPMVDISWIQKPEIGGISILDEMIVTLQPIIFKMDKKTGDDLMNYLFPKSDTRPKDYLKRTWRDSAVTSIKDIFSRVDRSDDQSSVDKVRDVDSWDLSSLHLTLSTRSGKSDSSKGATHAKELTIQKSRHDDDFFGLMLKRSSEYFNVRLVVINKTIMSVSYKGSHHLLTDVKDLTVKVPTLSYHNKLWSRDEFFAELKQDIIKIVLHHLGSIIGNKLIPHKKENKSKLKREIAEVLKTPMNSVKRQRSITESSPSNATDLTQDSYPHSQSIKDIGGSDDEVESFFPSNSDQNTTT